jgi:heme A synthase
LPTINRHESKSTYRIISFRFGEIAEANHADGSEEIGLRIGAKWFQITGILIVLEFLLGALVSGSIIDASYHIVLGLGVLAMAVATMVVAIISKPSSGSLKIASAVLVLLVVIQAPLGFAILDGHSSLLSALHAANAIAIIVTASISIIVARKWEKNKMRMGVKVETRTNRET